MAIPFTVDISAFYGEPDFREQNSSTIVDRRKTLNLHKELESGKTRDAVPQPRKREGGAIGFRSVKNSNFNSGGAIAFNGSSDRRVGGANCGDASRPGGAATSGGALAFNEQQLMNELTGLKKGGALGTVAATVIPALIQMAPQIISSIKELFKGKQGGALKFGGASAVFLNGIDPSKYDDVLKTMKAIERQSKNIEVRGGALYAGSSRVGTFFKNAWNKIKSWYDNNADKLKPITDILVNAGTNAANNAITKGVNYVSGKTGSDTVKQIANVVGDMAKDTVDEVANRVRGEENTGQATGSGYDVGDVENVVMPKEMKVKKRGRTPRIHTALPQSENKIHKSVVAPIRKRVY